MTGGRVLVVDDHAEMANTLAEGLADRGYDAVAEGSAIRALARLEREPFDLLVTDLRMSPVDGLELLARSRALDATRPVLIMTAYGAIDTAVEAIRQGAQHYLTKPFKLDELALFVERALADVRRGRETESLRKAMRERYVPGGMIGTSAPMRAVFDVADRIADTTAPVLLLGETGTGKGMVASALHGRSRRAGAPFVAVNCAALPDALLESELFGHVKGAFTGATSHRAGLFADADGGTLFLDEIGEMAPALQAKLLHVLEHGRIRPVGGSKETSVDVRIVAATHRDLRERVSSGNFREDLLYRLDVVSLELPPLRDRTEDLPDLVAHFVAASRTRYPDSPVERIGREALARMLEHAWPGNVRELAHVVERVVLLGRSAEVSLAELPASVRSVPPGGARAMLASATDVVPMREMQRQYARAAFERLGRNRTRTAEKLGIDFKTLAKWLDG